MLRGWLQGRVSRLSLPAVRRWLRGRRGQMPNAVTLAPGSCLPFFPVSRSLPLVFHVSSPSLRSDARCCECLPLVFLSLGVVSPACLPVSGRQMLCGSAVGCHCDASYGAVSPADALTLRWLHGYYLFPCVCQSPDAVTLAPGWCFLVAEPHRALNVSIFVLNNTYTSAQMWGTNTTMHKQARSANSCTAQT